MAKTANTAPPELRGARLELLQAFRRAQLAGRLAHAYLLLGPRGIGKGHFALALARQIVCPRAGEPGCPCQACALDLGRLAAGQHPEVHLVRAPDGKEIIPVETVREELVKAVQLRSYTAGRQVFIVEDAHRLAREGQNTTLKTLEEPGSGVHILLTTDAADQLLPTVRSRCHTVLVPPDEPEDFARRAGLDPNDALVRLAGGSASMLAQLRGEGGPLELTDDLVVWLRDAGDALALVDLLVPAGSTTKLESQQAVIPRLDSLAVLARDLLACASGAEDTLFHLARADELRELASALGAYACARVLAGAFAAKLAVRSYVDPTLAVLRMADEVVRLRSARG